MGDMTVEELKEKKMWFLWSAKPAKNDDVVYCKYYEVVYILFHTGMRISEFCGLTLKDIDLEKRIVNIDHQLQRTSDMQYIIENTKQMSEQGKFPSRRMWHRCFRLSLRTGYRPKLKR